MKNRLSLLFKTPSFGNDNNRTRRVELTNAIIVTTMLFLILTLIGNLLGGKTPTLTYIFNILALGICVLLNHSLRKGHVELAAVGIISLGLIIIPAGIASLGTIRTPTTAIYMLVVVASGLLFYSRGVWVVTVLSSLEIGALIIVENMGILPEPDYSVTVTQWITYTALFGLTSSLTLFAVLAANESLDRAETEIKERERTEAELRKLTRAVEQSPASIVITDLDANIEYVNSRFTKVTGYKFEEVIGENPRILKTELTAPGTHKLMWDTITAGKEWHGEFVNRKKDGSFYYELAVISAITDSDGVPTHYLAVKEDITDRKRVEDKLLEKDVQMRALNDNLPNGYTYQLDTGVHGEIRQFIYLSAGVEKIFGISPQQILDDPTRLSEQFLEEDNNKIAEIEALALADLTTFKAVSRFKRENDQIGWLLLASTPRKMKNNHIVWDGIALDITEQKQSEDREYEQRRLAEALSYSAAALNSTLKFDDVLDLILDSVGLVVPHDAANIMLLAVDGDQVSLVCHRGYVERGAVDSEIEQQFSKATMPLLTEVALSGKPLVIPDTRTNPAWAVFPFTKWVRSYLTVPIQIHEKTVGFLNLDSKTTGFFNHDHAERLQAFANHAAIAINNAHLYQEIHELAITDAVTNLFNRRYFDDVLEKEYSRHSRSNAELSLLILDVDHFKAFNDAYGHIRGDECLRQIARTIENSVSRPPDVAARYGGEEFVCLLPETNLEGAKTVSEKIRRGVMEIAIPHSYSGVAQVVTVSSGVATVRCNKDGHPSEIVAKADEQLYLAKSRGRNRTEAIE